MRLSPHFRGSNLHLGWNAVLAAIGVALGGLAVLAGSSFVYGSVVLFLLGGAVLVLQPMWGLVVFMFAGRQRIPFFGDSLPEWMYAAVPLLLCILIGTTLAARRNIAVRLSRFERTAVASAIGLGAWMLFSLIWSPSSDYAMTKMLEYGGLTLAGFLLAMRLCVGEREREQFLLAMVGISLGLALIALVVNRVTLLDQSANSLSALGGGRNTFARLTSLGALVSISWVVGSRSVAVRAGAAVAALVLIVSTLFSGSRGSTIAFVCALAAATVLMMRSGRSLRIAGLVIGTGVLGVITFVLLNSDLPAIQRFSLLLEGGGSSIAARLNWINSAMELIRSRSLLGHGLGAFAPLVVGVDQIEYPHNIFIELLLETGLIGLTMLLTFLCSVVGAVLQALKQVDSSRRLPLLLVFSCFVFSVVAAQFSGDLYDSRLIWIFGGAALACARSVASVVLCKEAEVAR